MDLKSLFEKAEGGSLTYESFMAKAAEAGAKFVDLSEGQYVSKHKYDDELSAKAKEIETLNGTISTRDTDLAALQKQLEEAGTDAEKLNTLSGDLASLQTKYEADIKSYKDQLRNQAYEFAVKEYAATQKFSSSAARRDFTQAMLAKGLKMDKDKILGADDFASAYKAENSDAFVVEDKGSDQKAPEQSFVPQFVQPTPGGTPQVDQTGGFASAFHFTGVREIPKS